MATAQQRRQAKTLKNPSPVELPSGRWRCQVTINGKRVSVVEDDPKTAHAKAVALKAEVIERNETPQKLTVSKAIDLYIESKSVLSPSTLYGYRSIQRTRFQDAMSLDIHQISEQQWQAFCNAEAALCSPKTLKNAWMFLSSVIYRSTRKRMEISLPAVPKNDRPYLTHDQILVFVDHARGSKCEIPALLALCSLRRSEILALCWKDIDLEQELVYVRGAAVMGQDSKLVYKDTNKNESSQRIVPILIPRLSNAIRERMGNPEEHIVKGNPNQIWAQINSICDQAGLPRVGVHGLRHSFASLAYYLEIPDKTAMKIGGWKDSKTMRDIYTHIAQQDIAEKAKKIRDFYSGKNEADILVQKEMEIASLKAQIVELQERLSILDTLQKQFSILIEKGV